MEHTKDFTLYNVFEEGACVSHLFLLEVAQGLHHDRAATLLLGVARLQPNNCL